MSTVSAVGCSAQFTPRSLVDKPRIIGVVATPPQVDFDADYQGVTTLYAVIGLPTASTDPGVVPDTLTGLEWTACLFGGGATAGYYCPEMFRLPLTNADFDSQNATFDTTLVHQGLQMVRESGELASFMPQFVEILRSTVEQDDTCLRSALEEYDVCSAESAEVPGTCAEDTFDRVIACQIERGIDVQVELKATFSRHSQGDDDAWLFDENDAPVMETFVQTGYRTVRLGGISDAKLANTNPGITLLVDETPVIDTETRTQMTQILACPGAVLRMEPLPIAGTIGTYLDEDGNVVTDAEGNAKDEYLFFSYLANSGEFSITKTSNLTAFEDQEPVTWAELTLLDAETMPSVFNVWVFVRDGELGADFVTFEITRSDDPALCLPDPISNLAASADTTGGDE